MLLISMTLQDQTKKLGDIYVKVQINFGGNTFDSNPAGETNNNIPFGGMFAFFANIMTKG